MPFYFSLLSILLHTRNRIHNRYFHCSAAFSISNVNLFKVIVYFYTFDFFFMYLLKFFKNYHTHQRRTVHPSFSFISNDSAHFPTTDMESAVREGCCFSIRNACSCWSLIVWGLVSTLSRKNISEENIPVGLCFPIVLRDYFPFLSSGYIDEFGRSIRSPHNHLWYLSLHSAPS